MGKSSLLPIAAFAALAACAEEAHAQTLSEEGQAQKAIHAELAP